MSDGTDCVVFSQCDMPNGAFPLMEELRRQGHLIDVTILVGKTQHSIDAHKLVLASTVSTTRVQCVNITTIQSVFIGESQCSYPYAGAYLALVLWVL